MSESRAPAVELVGLKKLKPTPRNTRTHSKKQVQQIANSIQQFGWTNPILVDEQYEVIAGNGRFLAAQHLGLRNVPIIMLKGLSEPQKRALVIADNKIAANAGWDRATLAAELSELATLLPEAGLSTEITGFEPAEFDSLMGDLIDVEAEPLEQIPELSDVAVTRSGDLWVLGQHRILCGDARRASDVRALVGRGIAAMVFTDPPYNVRIASVQGRGRIRHREFRLASGEMSSADYIAFLKETLSHAAKASSDGSIHFICMDWRHINELSAAGRSVYTELKNLVVWAKTNAGQGSFYRSQHELIFVFKKGDASHVNNFALGQHGRMRSNVWTYAGVNSFRADRLDELKLHPTVKPIAMVADAMRDCSRRGDIILDPFLGAGTTVMAAERVGRRGYGIEIDPLYVDAAVRRWQAYTKRDAVLEKTGETFNELAALRGDPPSRRKVP